MKRFISCTSIALSTALILLGCTSREDEYFPEFTPLSPIIVSSNEAVEIQGVFQPREICRIGSNIDANKIYQHLKINHNSNWKRTDFRLYVPRYYINFGGVKIEILKGGGLAINAPRPDDLFTDTGKVQFVRHSPRKETFNLIKHLCPLANPAGPHESPAVEVEISNMSDQKISDVTISGGGQTRSIASIEPLRTATVSLVPIADSILEVSFASMSANRFKCPTRTFVTPGMNGTVEIDINDVMDCEIRRDSTSLF